MDDFDYSLEALSVLNLFHDCNIILYVEGDDDICFWQNILDLAQITDCHIESVNGSKNLSYKIEQARQGAKVLIAMDRDDALLDEAFDKHPQIITTYGHSLENHIYCPATISKVANYFSKTNVNLKDIVNKWFDDFSESCGDLIVYNIANNLHKRGVVVFGESCCRFLTTDKSCKISSHKVGQYLEGVKQNFTEQEVQACINLVKNFRGHKRFLVRGHFMSLAVINLIKLLVRRLRGTSVMISIENLYALCINGCKSCKDLCFEINEIIVSMKKAYQTVCTEIVIT